MNRYKINKELRSISIATEKEINKILEPFGFRFVVNISPHVADRIIDISSNVVRDIRNINYIMQQIRKNYICNLMYYSKKSHRLLVYTKYTKNVSECFALGTTLFVEGSIIKFTVRTFLPDFKTINLSRKVNLQIKEPIKKMYNVNSPLHRMIYSDHCPDELKMLRD